MPPIFNEIVLSIGVNPTPPEKVIGNASLPVTTERSSLKTVTVSAWAILAVKANVAVASNFRLYCKNEYHFRLR